MHSALQLRGASVAPTACSASRTADRVGACSLALSTPGYDSTSSSCAVETTGWRCARRRPFSSQLLGGTRLESRGDAFCTARARSEDLVAMASEVVTENGNVRDSALSTESPFRLAPEDRPVYKKVEPGNGHGQTKLGRPTTGALEVDGFSIEGVSVGGQETCVMLPALKVAFDIGRCPARAIDQDFLFITHPHMDHIGGLAMYVACRGMLKRKVPTVIVPKCVKATVEKLFAVQRDLDASPLPVNLIGMAVGEERDLSKGFIVKSFKTYHVVPSQGYVIYSVKQKLKQEYVGLSGKEIGALRASGVQVTESIRTPEVAFTGDTTSSFFRDEANKDILNARLLIMECTFLDRNMSVENANEYGHTHLFEILAHAEKFKNKSIVLIHFSARYTQQDIFAAIKKIPPPLQGRVFPLTEGF